MDSGYPSVNRMPYFEPLECNCCSTDPTNKLNILRLVDRLSSIREGREASVVPGYKNIVIDFVIKHLITVSNYISSILSITTVMDARVSRFGKRFQCGWSNV